MTAERGKAVRGRRTREAFHAVVALTLLASAGCTSNRFRLANDPRINRSAELATIDERTRQVPSAPTGLPVAPAIVAAPDNPDVDGALNGDRVASDDARVPAATYPPRAVATPFNEPDPDAALVQDDRNSEAGLNSQPRREESRPGPRGTLVGQPVGAPQIAGRVVNPYGRPEPNASIQVYDLAENRRLVAETASGPDGRFRAQNLEPGRKYEIAAATLGTGVRLVGSTTATPPDGAAVVRLEPDNRTRAGSTFGALENIPGAKALQGLVSRPNPETQPIADNVRISTPRLVASRSSASDLENAVAVERTTPESEPATLPRGGAKPKPLPSAAPAPAAPVYQPPATKGVATGKLNFPIIYRDGTPGILEQIPGEIILVDFWGTWCGPCKRAIPHLNALHQKYSARGLHIVGAAAEHGTRGAQLQTLNQARDANKIQYTAVLCPGALGEACPLRSAFNVSSFPTFVLIDRSGRVLFTGQGANEETLVRLDQAIGSYLSSVVR